MAGFNGSTGSPSPDVNKATGILKSNHGGTSSSVDGTLYIVRPTLADDLKNFFLAQPEHSIRFIPSGIHQGNVIGPDGATGGANWFVISYRYSALGTQWGFIGSGASAGIYRRSYNNGTWSEWTKVA